ncbi:hypothetical protein GCM10010174_26150 [Kutzneria viridogrisea]|uniref:Uncharacterized protein n=1 Tax=Kutzneria viridogrisea TaxID=47990 RepID=A0ABR6BRJ6_9PSEU|nr:hypothetical protein [Kutzneria viridogrisea]
MPTPNPPRLPASFLAQADGRWQRTVADIREAGYPLRTGPAGAFERREQAELNLIDLAEHLAYTRGQHQRVTRGDRVTVDTDGTTIVTTPEYWDTQIQQVKAALTAAARTAAETRGFRQYLVLRPTGQLLVQYSDTTIGQAVAEHVDTPLFDLIGGLRVWYSGARDAPFRDRNLIADAALIALDPEQHQHWTGTVALSLDAGGPGPVATTDSPLGRHLCELITQAQHGKLTPGCRCLDAIPGTDHQA